MFSMTVTGKTDTGKARTNNEDSFYVNPPLMIVADGMGGAAAGEIASRLAVETISASLDGISFSTDEELIDDIRDAILNADRAIKDEASAHPEHQGMGTTVVVAMHLDDSVLIAFVGDSRAYVVSRSEETDVDATQTLNDVSTTAATAIMTKFDDQSGDSGGQMIHRITEDHSVVMDLVSSGVIKEEDIRSHPLRNRITRCVGNLEASQGPDFVWHTLTPGDKLIMCSDGLWEMVNEDIIYAISQSTDDTEQICTRLIAAANDAGGSDNITVITANFTEK